MRAQAVIFDCDGVLVDSEPITMGVLAAMANEAGLNMTEHEAAEAFMGRSLCDDVALIESMLGRALPSGWVDTYLERRNVALRARVTAVRGIVRVLDALSAHGIPVAVASGGDRAKMRLTLGTSGLLHRFETLPPQPDSPVPHSDTAQPSRLFGADMVERAKPAPDVYLMAAQALGVQPAHCVVIEDTPVGVRAGLAAGATVLGYCERNDPHALLDVGASAVFRDMHHLPALLAL
jgi:beta-phosphoglucomutase-like phosphatase (HAD superfamily)